VQFQVGFHVGSQLFHERAKNFFQGSEWRRNPLQVARGEIEAMSLCNSLPVLHQNYDTESSGLGRAVHSAPASTTIEAMKLHSRIATE